MRPRYRFNGRSGDTYYWEGPRVDSRVLQITCNRSWFWSTNRIERDDDN